MAPSRALLDKTPASALACGLPFAPPIPANPSCFRRHSSAPLGRIQAVLSHQSQSSAPLGRVPEVCSLQQMAELKTADVIVTSSRDCFSQLATMLVAGACAAAAFGCSTPHFGAAYAVEGVAEESITIFERSCAGCHAGGGNVLQPNATLFAKDLDRSGMANADGIFQITYFGKGRMPGYGEKCTPRGQCTFGPRLSDSDIRALAEFVRLQADLGWTAR